MWSNTTWTTDDECAFLRECQRRETLRGYLESADKRWWPAEIDKDLCVAYARRLLLMMEEPAA
jgi:hypothetical protein